MRLSIAIYTWAAIVAVTACDKQATKSAVDVAVQVNEQVCKELLNEPHPPQWVVLECTAAGIVGGVTKIFLPAKTWAAMKKGETAAIAVIGDAGAAHD